MTTIQCMVPEIWSAIDRIFCHFGLLFFAILPSMDSVNQNFEKMKKTPGDIIILHQYTKNHDHMLHCSWDTMHDRCNFYFSFWAIFHPLPPPPLHNDLKNQNFTKMKLTAGDIIILRMCTKNNDHMMYGSWDMVHNGRTGRQVGRQDGKMTYRGGCPT